MKLLLIPVAMACLMLPACRTNESPEGQVDDLKIVAEVKSKLAADVSAGTLTNVTVDSTNGIVTLAGQVDSADAKAKAESIAKAAPKAVRVIDNLQVTPRPPSQ